MSTIPAETSLGPVALTVSDLSRSLDFYRQHLGLQVHRQQDNEAFLGVGAEDLLRLLERPGARSVRGVAGLYHFAILVPSRLELAHVLRNFAENNTPMQGFSDHLVSEALYLADPDGNGIEVYRDRPRSEWPVVNGELRMATDPLDLQDVMKELQRPGNESDGPWTGMPQGTIIGHVHLHVSNLSRDEAFYRDVMGFDLMVRYPPAASFLSAGGYHHHIGINVWAGTGIPPTPADAAGLRWFTINLPTAEARSELESRLKQQGVNLQDHAEGTFLRDPAGNGIVLALSSKIVDQGAIKPFV